MHSRHVQLHQALAVLAPPKRFELLVLTLSGADRSVSQLAAAVKLSQSCTTRHLQALERAGLVKGVRDGKRVVFRPAPRDPTAAGVLESLTGGGQLAAGAAQRSDAAAARALARAARSSPVQKGPPSGPASEPRAGAPDPPAQHAASESGNYSTTTSPSPRVFQELEDFLL
jgi:DNA-binding transcriptional ArsR family regulator